jgi:hypothetical protein
MMPIDDALRRGDRRRGWAMAAAVAVLTMALTYAPRATAQGGEGAEKLLKAMSDYVGAQKTISLSYDSDIEVITTALQKIQFTSSGRVQLSRPDKLRVTRTGGYADVELVFDGKMLTIFGKNLNAYTQVDTPGTVDQLIERLHNDFSISAPGADLLLTKSYDELMADVIEAKHIGRRVIDGVECEHLAFRNTDTDWQIWVEMGARPIPRKYVITNKGVTSGPQYTLRIKEWRTDTPAAADAFVFRPPQGASAVSIEALATLDEVPHGIATGGKQ